MEKSQTLSVQRNIPVTYPEAVVSDAAAPRPRTKLLVEADDLIDEVLANLALKLFILLRSNLTVFKERKCNLRIHSKDLEHECAQ